MSRFISMSMMTIGKHVEMTAQSSPPPSPPLGRELVASSPRTERSSKLGARNCCHTATGTVRGSGSRGERDEAREPEEHPREDEDDREVEQLVGSSSRSHAAA